MAHNLVSGIKGSGIKEANSCRLYPYLYPYDGIKRVKIIRDNVKPRGKYKTLEAMIQREWEALGNTSQLVNLTNGKDEVSSSNLDEGSSEIKASRIKSWRLFSYLLLPYYYQDITRYNHIEGKFPTLQSFVHFQSI